MIAGFSQKWEGYGTKKIEIWIGERRLKIEYRFNCWYRRLEGIRISTEGFAIPYFQHDDVILANIYEDKDGNAEYGDFIIIYGDGGILLETKHSGYELLKSFSRKYKDFVYDVLGHEKVPLQVDLDLMKWLLIYLEDHMKYKNDREIIKEFRHAISTFLAEFFIAREASEQTAKK